MIRCLGCMAEYEEQYTLCPHCGYSNDTTAAEALHMEPGSILHDKYIVGKVLGFGGFGVTYIGWDALLEQTVAIKEYLPSEFSTRMPGQTQVTVFNGDKQEQFQDGLKKFVDEAQRLAQFHNTEGIVRIFDSFEENGTAYIIMEYLDGETLKSYLEENGAIPPEDAVDMLMPVMESLRVVHEAGIIHRDIAPDNIFLTRDGRVKLIDFGAARFATTSHSRSLTVIIKPGFSPEEQYRSRGDQGTWTDVYAVGATMYKMITGKTPPDALERRAMFESKKKDILKPLSKFCESIPVNIETAVLNAMNVRIEDRTQDMTGLIGELTSEEPVKRRAGKIKKIDVLKWPLWAKIGVPAVAALVLALSVLFITGVIRFDAGLMTSINIPDGMSRVPSVISDTMEKAEERLEKAVLLYQITGKEYSNQIPADLVLTQSLDAGSVVTSNSMMDITISGGAELKVVPSVEGLSAEEAQQLLEDAGFAVHIVEEFSDSVAAGSVISQDQAADSEYGLGETITITVSKGLDPASAGDQRMTKVPNFVGMKYNDALAAAKKAGFLLNVKTKAYSVEHGKDVVMSQNVEAGSTIMSGNTIDLVVSLGKQTVLVPDVQYKTEAEARQTLSDAGLTASISYAQSETVQSGNVISQSPAAKSSVVPSAAVNLSVSKGGTSFAMPNVVGQSESNATSTLQGKGLSVSVSYEKSDSVAEGNVIRQSVSAGSNVQRGASVTITVSSGKNLVSVANVVGKFESDAKSTLQNQGLRTSSSEAYSATVAKGSVISQNPGAGSSQAAGTTIVLTVSKGLEPPNVPDVVGKSRSNAESTLTNLGLKVSVTEEYSDTVANGNVISQNPTSGRSADVGSTVTLKVSKGKPIQPVPNLAGKTKSEAETTLKGLGLQVAYAPEQNSNTVSSGSVISQSPTSGTNAFKGDTVTLTLSIGKPIVDVTNFAISGAGSVMEGKTLQLTVTSIQPSSADNKTPSWESKNTGIADVSSTGLVSAKAAGSATIQATIGMVVKTCTVTVTAIPKFTISYNANGGSNAPSSQEKTYDIPLALTSSKPTAPAGITISYNANGGSNAPASTSITKTFSNWNTNSNGSGTTYQSGGSYTPNAAATLFAQWASGAVPYYPSGPTTPPASITITYNANGGSNAPASQTGAYTFKNWNTSSSGSGNSYATGGTISLSSSATLYAQWNKPSIVIISSKPTAPASIIVNFNYNGGSGSPSSVTSSATFNNWDTVQLGGGSSYSSGSTYSDVSRTLFAQWSWSNKTITLPTPNTRSGYTFNGWYDASSGGNKIGNAGASYTVNASKTLYAQWATATYTITYNANGGSVTPATATVNAGEYHILPTATRSGYTFNGWFTAATGGTKIGGPAGTGTGANYVVPDKDITLFAQWTAITYTVSYNANGGSGTTTSSSHTYDVAKNLTSNGFTLTGYTFTGWATSSGGSVAYTNQQSVTNLSSTNNATVTLYAKWTQDVINSITVSKQPSKMTYNRRDYWRGSSSIDPTGLVIDVNYTSGIKNTVSYSTDMFSIGWFDSLGPLSTQTRIRVYHNSSGKYVFITVNIDDPLTAIKVTKLPNKTIYRLGEQLDLYGMEVTYSFTSGYSYIESGVGYSCTCTPKTWNTIGIKTITATCGNQTTTFNIEVVP